MKPIQKIFVILLMLGPVTMVLANAGSLNSGIGESGGVVEGVLEEASQESLPISVDRRVALPILKDQIPQPEIFAKSVLVKDFDSGTVLFEKNLNMLLPIASLTKLMTAIVAKKTIPEGEVIKIEQADLKIPANRADFVPGEKIVVGDLLQAILIGSANDAAMALARAGGIGDVEKFVKEMNSEARTLGMRQTTFANPVGLDDPGQYSTASDLAKLVEEFLKYPDLLEIVRKKSAVIESVDGRFKHTLKTTNELLTNNQEVIGLKTGYTGEARGNLIILVDFENLDQKKAGQYYSIILGSEDREAETKKIMEWVKESFEWEN